MFKDNNLFVNWECKRRKHYEIRQLHEEEQLPEPERKTRKVLRDLNPLKISKQKIFSIISLFLINKKKSVIFLSI